VNELKKKLTVAENKLTDIRLEALSSVHQVDQLRDFMEKMRNEMVSLKSENSLLKRHLKDMQACKIDLEHASELSDVNKIEQIFQSLNNSLTNYHFSYSK